MTGSDFATTYVRKQGDTGVTRHNAANSASFLEKNKKNKNKKLRQCLSRNRRRVSDPHPQLYGKM
jgi:hypothetical protein